MYDLSWLNPTPHAIAVYASQLLSPAATQHSLPSGRYSLLGPDLHRLDRTSLRLAHLLNHLVGLGEDRGRHSEAERLGCSEVNHQLVFCRCLHRQLGWLLALENAVDIASRLPQLLDDVSSVTDQSAVSYVIAVRVNRRQ